MATRTCKLEYMMRNFNSDDKKEIIWLIDKDGERDFCSFNIRAFTKFKELKTVPNDSFAALEYKFALYDYERVSLRFESIFRRINELFIKNNIQPIFTDPTNIDECLDIRDDMIEPMSYDRANEFFGVSNYWEYVPPYYNEKSK